VSKKNRKKKQTRPQSSAPAKFSPTTMVRVKPGTLDPDFADIPLGGWPGTNQKIDQTTDPRVFLVHWNQETLDQMHPVFRKRCQRDDLEIESMWLGEDDLELDTGEPARIEQLTSLITRSLSKNDQDDRIRAIFDLTSDDPLPEINEDNLRKYHRYLATHLSLPFNVLRTFSFKAGGAISWFNTIAAAARFSSKVEVGMPQRASNRSFVIIAPKMLRGGTGLSCADKILTASFRLAIASSGLPSSS